MGCQRPDCPREKPSVRSDDVQDKMRPDFMHKVSMLCAGHVGTVDEFVVV